MGFVNLQDILYDKTEGQYAWNRDGGGMLNIKIKIIKD